MAQFSIIKGSAYWASYLINGDASGLTDREVKLANKWLAENEVLDVVDCAEEAHFTWHYPIHTGDNSVQGGDVIEYTVRIE